MKYLKLCLYVLMTGSFGNANAVRVFDADNDTTTPKQSIGEIIGYLRSIDSKAPTYDSSGKTASVNKGDDKVYSFVFSQWSNGVEVGDFFSTDNISWYKIVTVDPSGKLLQLDRPFVSTPGWKNIPYNIVQGNIINLDKGNYYESLDMSDILFLMIVGDDRRSVVMHPASEGDYTYSNGANICRDVLARPVQNGIFTKMPTSGQYEVHNISFKFNSTGEAIFHNDQIKLPNIHIKNIDVDMSYGSDIMYITGAEVVTISDSTFRGTGDGITIAKAIRAEVKNTLLATRYIPCLPAFAVAGLRFDDVETISVDNAHIQVDANPLHDDHGIFRIITKNSASQTSANVKASSFSGNSHPSVRVEGNVTATFESINVHTLGHQLDLVVGDGATVNAICSNGINNISVSEGALYSPTC